MTGDPRTPSVAGQGPARRPFPGSSVAPDPRRRRDPLDLAAPTSGARRVADPAAPPAVPDGVVERRGIAVVAIAVVAFSVMLDGPLSWLAAALLGGGVLLAARSAARDAGPPVVAAMGGRISWRAVAARLAGLEAGLIPGVMAAGLVLSSRLVAIDWILVPVLVLAGLLLGWAVAVERRLAVAATWDELRWEVLLATLAAAFVGFAGVAAMVAGGLAEPLSRGAGAAIGASGTAAVSMGEADLLLLAAGDAVIAGLLGFRLVRLGPATRWEAVLSASSYAAVVALGAGLLRAMAIPQLVGPALLTMLLYLWDAFHATTPSIRRDPRWRWQVALLVVLSAVVIAWNLRLRGT